MIFVTVGTHEQPFNRLVRCIDELKMSGEIEEEVIIQMGYSTYEPKACEWSKLYSYEQMQAYVKEARLVITHGGPSSFVMPLQIGKIPIVVPRKKGFAEHVNNHQVDFCNAVRERLGNIIVVEEISQLGEVIREYDRRISLMPAEIKSNNESFCRQLDEIVEEMF